MIKTDIQEDDGSSTDHEVDDFQSDEEPPEDIQDKQNTRNQAHHIAKALQELDANMDGHASAEQYFNEKMKSY